MYAYLQYIHVHHVCVHYQYITRVPGSLKKSQSSYTRYILHYHSIHTNTCTRLIFLLVLHTGYHTVPVHRTVLLLNFLQSVQYFSSSLQVFLCVKIIVKLGYGSKSEARAVLLVRRGTDGVYWYACECYGRSITW
jgi:hypothetical protein